ncbi:hypothetical protein BP00DRAFT_454840 [Aspergillus indologenus CBS 114.80]|uniref:Uncharacterized protein n=1 Tax=Aspergillus indologenus CBS 114.80 TaxID=1450541 RepID=A0A2V5IGA8_9EURO|nr:hypothetical protein BP00DRAFT_454840 [Aspergillus indologenus CBS 114.80]
MTPSRATQVHDDHTHTHKRTSSSSAYSRKSTEDYRRYSGTVNHCGRHSNDWLFGGFSLRDTVRGETTTSRSSSPKGFLIPENLPIEVKGPSTATARTVGGWLALLGGTPWRQKGRLTIFVVVFFLVFIFIFW